MATDGRPVPTQQVVLAAAADAREVPHECGCLECPQHAWDRGRDVQAARPRRARGGEAA